MNAKRLKVKPDPIKIYALGRVSTMSIHVPCKLLDTQCCPRYRTLDQVDQDLRASSYRQNDLLLLRYPDFSDQDLTDFFEGTCVIGLLLVDNN